MAATRGIVTGYSKTGKASQASRLGHASVAAQAATWRTFATVEVFADGSGTVKVERDGETLHTFAFGNESTSGIPERSR